VYIGNAFDMVSTCLARYDDEVQLPEVVIASCDRGGTSGSKSRGQEADVSSLVVGKSLNLGVKLGVVTCRSKLSCIVLDMP